MARKPLAAAANLNSSPTRGALPQGKKACANPGSVYIYAPPDMVAPKHARLHRDLFERGLAKPFTGTPPLFGHEAFTHAPLNAAGDVAVRIAELLAARSQKG